MSETKSYFTSSSTLHTNKLKCLSCIFSLRSEFCRLLIYTIQKGKFLRFLLGLIILLSLTFGGNEAAEYEINYITLLMDVIVTFGSLFSLQSEFCCLLIYTIQKGKILKSLLGLILFLSIPFEVIQQLTERLITNFVNGYRRNLWQLIFLVIWILPLNSYRECKREKIWGCLIGLTLFHYLPFEIKKYSLLWDLLHKLVNGYHRNLW